MCKDCLRFRGKTLSISFEVFNYMLHKSCRVSLPQRDKSLLFFVKETSPCNTKGVGIAFPTGETLLFFLKVYISLQTLRRRVRLPYRIGITLTGLSRINNCGILSNLVRNPRRWSFNFSLMFTTSLPFIRRGFPVIIF